MIVLRSSMQGDDILKHGNSKCQPIDNCVA